MENLFDPRRPEPKGRTDPRLFPDAEAPGSLLNFPGIGVSEILEIGEKGLPDVAAQSEANEFALAFDGYEAGGFELVEMMGERGGGDLQTLAHVATACAAFAGAEALDDFHAAWVGEGFQDHHALGR